jgi:hypothetical protein
MQKRMTRHTTFSARRSMARLRTISVPEFCTPVILARRIRRPLHGKQPRDLQARFVQRILSLIYFQKKNKINWSTKICRVEIDETVTAFERMFAQKAGFDLSFSVGISFGKL